MKIINNSLEHSYDRKKESASGGSRTRRLSFAGVLFSSATADNAVYCIIGCPSVQYTPLHYWIMSFSEKCELMAWVVLTMIKGCP